LSVHGGLQVMSLEPLELPDHNLAGRDQYVATLVGKGARPEGFREAQIRASFLGRIPRSSDDQAVNHSAGMLDTIGRDAAAMSVAE
jgi:hypothetical protein